MTTLRDILNDLADQVIKNEQLEPEFKLDSKEIVDEHCEMISERIFGIVTPRLNQLSY